MDPAAQKRRRRGRRLVWGLIALLAIVPVGGMLYATFGPNPPILISKATTHLTAPLDADGLPDYAAALLADMKKGVTPENNGAVLLLQSFWPGEYEFAPGVSPDDSTRLCKELGLRVAPSSELSVTSINTDERRLRVVTLLRRHLRAAQADDPTGYGDRFSEYGISSIDAEAVKDERIDEILYMAYFLGRRQWSDDDLPFLADWLEQNKVAIDRIVTASERPQWYLPSVLSISPERGVVSQSHLGASLLLEAIRLLQTRALYYLGTRRYADAARDASAALHLTRHAGKCPLLSDQMIAVNFGQVAFGLVTELAAEPSMPRAVLLELLRRLDELGPPTNIARSLQFGERLSALDFAVRAHSIGVAGLKAEYEAAAVLDDVDFEVNWELFSPEIHRMASSTSIDWNLVMEDFNRACDRFVAAMRLPSRKQRYRSLAILENETKARLARAEANQNRWLLKLSRHGRARLVADYWIGASAQGIQHSLRHEDWLGNSKILTQLHLALAIHRAEHGTYPESLEALAPVILPELPVDPYNAKPYAYRQTEDGFLLYSLGENGRDDGGSHDSELYDGRKFEGTAIDEVFNNGTDKLTPEEQAAYDLLEKIPAGADDVSLRVPLPIEPWPWEE